jgi:uncharacterized membrane protein YczE
MPKWIHSIRAWSVFLTFMLLFFVIIFDRLTPEVMSLVTFVVGLVIGNYFAKRDEKDEK